MQQKAGETVQTHMQGQRQTPHIFRVLFGLLITTTSLAGALFLISIALAKAMQQKGLRDSIRRFNKRTLNPVTLKIAGNRLRIYAAIKHVGHLSGQAYTTPVVARPFGGGFIIPLPYGTDVDWCRNVMAAGKCTLVWNEREYTLEKPEIITPSEALGAYPLLQKLTGGIKQYLWLHQHVEVPKKASKGNDTMTIS